MQAQYLTQAEQIQRRNLEYYGIDVSAAVRKTGVELAAKLNEEYPNTELAFVVASIPQAKFILATVCELAKTSQTIHLYLLCRTTKLPDDLSQTLWQELVNSTRHNSRVQLLQDCNEKHIQNHDVFVMAVADIDQAATPRVQNVIKRITHFRKEIINFDFPASGYKWHKSISLDYPKTPDASVVNSGLSNLIMQPGPGELEVMFIPRKASYKSDNGKLFILLGQTSAAAIAELETAAKDYRVETQYFALDPKSAEFVPARKLVDEGDMERNLRAVDTIATLGQFPESYMCYSLLRTIMRDFPEKKYVFTSENLKLEKLPKHCVIFTNRKDVVNYPPLSDKGQNSQVKIKDYCRKNDCCVVLGGSQTLLIGNNPYAPINTYHAPTIYPPQYWNLFKSLATVYSTKNPLWLAMCAGSLLS